jgi:hypothetical protein
MVKAVNPTAPSKIEGEGNDNEHGALSCEFVATFDTKDADQPRSEAIYQALFVQGRGALKA